MWVAIPSCKYIPLLDCMHLRSKLQMILVNCALWPNTISDPSSSHLFFCSLAWFILEAWMPCNARKCWISRNCYKTTHTGGICPVAFPPFNSKWFQNFQNCFALILFIFSQNYGVFYLSKRQASVLLVPWKVSRKKLPWLRCGIFLQIKKNKTPRGLDWEARRRKREKVSENFLKNDCRK